MSLCVRSEGEVSGRGSSGVQAWDKRPDEPAMAYAAFRLYLGLAPETRSVRATWRVWGESRRPGREANVAAALAAEGREPRSSPAGSGRAGGEKDGGVSSKFSAWARAWEWKARAGAYDAYMTARADEAAALALEARAAGTVQASGIWAGLGYAGRLENLEKRRKAAERKRLDGERLLRLAEYVTGFPLKEERRDGPNGPVVVAPINVDKLAQGARIYRTAHTLVEEALREELALVYSGPGGFAAPGGVLPDVESERLAESARLGVLLEGLTALALAGDRQAVSDALRVSERRCRLLGLDAPRAEVAQGGGYAGGSPEYIEVVMDEGPGEASGEAGGESAGGGGGGGAGDGVGGGDGVPGSVEG